MFSKKAPRKLKNFIFEKEFLRKGISINRYRCFVTNNPRMFTRNWDLHVYL